MITRLDVDYDTSERIQLSYDTPIVTDRIGNFYRYRLLLQKQLGARDHNINLQIKLPENAQIVSVSPETSANYELDNAILDFRFTLSSDQWVDVIYQLP